MLERPNRRARPRAREKHGLAHKWCAQESCQNDTLVDWTGIPEACTQGLPMANARPVLSLPLKLERRYMQETRSSGPVPALCKEEDAGRSCGKHCSRQKDVPVSQTKTIYISKDYMNLLCGLHPFSSGCSPNLVQSFNVHC